MPSDLKRGGTVATAELDIDGLPNRLNGHSRIDHEYTGKGSESFVKDGSGNFDHFPSPTASGHITDGSSHAEYRILDNIADQLGNNPSATGKIDLFIELPPCSTSCGVENGLIDQFRARYPLIELNIADNSGVRLRP